MQQFLLCNRFYGTKMMPKTVLRQQKIIVSFESNPVSDYNI